jgi:hypothetical protein
VPPDALGELCRLGERRAAPLAISVGPALLAERDQELGAAGLVRLCLRERLERALVLPCTLCIGQALVRLLRRRDTGRSRFLGRATRQRLEEMVRALRGRRNAAADQALSSIWTARRPPTSWAPGWSAS